MDCGFRCSSNEAVVIKWLKQEAMKPGEKISAHGFRLLNRSLPFSGSQGFLLKL
jgi:hypothetical protein